MELLKNGSGGSGLSLLGRAMGNFSAASSWRRRGGVAIIATSLAVVSSHASATTLYEAIKIALEANPEIGQAIANREAIEFELRQGEGGLVPPLVFFGGAGGGHE